MAVFRLVFASGDCVSHLIFILIGQLHWSEVEGQLVDLAAFKDASGGGEGGDLAFEIARQVIVLEQDTVLERLMPALDLALGHRMIRRAAGMLHVLAVEPFG
jgi:hypothetical protein